MDCTGELIGQKPFAQLPALPEICLEMGEAKREVRPRKIVPDDRCQAARAGQGQESRRRREVSGAAQPDQGSNKQRRCARIKRQRLPDFQVRKCKAACELPQQHEVHRRRQHHKKVGQLWSDIEYQAGECRSAQRTRNGKREQDVEDECMECALGGGAQDRIQLDRVGARDQRVLGPSSIARIEFPSA
jgi:hypothetical protein